MGSATVEFALVLPAAFMLLALALGSVRWAIDEAVVRDAAATAARVALVDGAAAGGDAARAGVPEASVHIVRDGVWWVAEVRLRIRGPLPDAVATARAYQP